MTKKLIQEGAEAKIYLEGEKVRKERTRKEYRHPILDEKLRKSRTKHEARILTKAKTARVNVPKIYNLNKNNEPIKKYSLDIEYINGEKLAEKLNSYPEKKQLEIMKKLGREVAKMHENDIIHGDLTTSNTILKENQIYIIDFGLGYISRKIEDKAVDLHLIKQAIIAKHWQNPEKLFNAFKSGYNCEEKDKILERLTAVERRGRYKH